MSKPLPRKTTSHPRLTFIGGSQLSRHWADSDWNNPRDELATGEYDLQVVAGGGGGSFDDYAARFADLAQANGADILYYGIWAPDNYISTTSDTVTDRFHKQYTKAAINNDGGYSPNGVAYARAHEALTEKYGNGDQGQTAESMLTFDNIHASPLAALLVASTLYATIFEEKAPTGWRPPGVSAADAKLMQDIAWQTAREFAISPDGNFSSGGGGAVDNGGAVTKPVVEETQSDADAGTIKGKIFVDANSNNRDDDEAGLKGHQVSLYDMQKGRVVERTTTDNSGNYSFDDVAAGSYRVHFADAPNGDWAKANVGGETTDSDIVKVWNNGGGQTAQFRLNDGATVSNIDAGVQTGSSSSDSGGSTGGTTTSGDILIQNTVRGSSKSETLNGTSRNDKIDGYGGQDTIKAYGGDDYINGGGSADRVFAGGGDDQIVFDYADTHVYGEAGTDTFVFNGGIHNFNGLTLNSVEVFDLENNRGDKLSMDAKHVAQADGKTLIVSGDASDELRIDTWGDTRKIGETRIDGETHDQYRLANGSTIYIDDDINYVFI